MIAIMAPKAAKDSTIMVNYERLPESVASAKQVAVRRASALLTDSPL